MELQLDWQKQKGGVRRALFLASGQAALTQTLLIQNGAREDCSEMKIYLRVRPPGGVAGPGGWPRRTGVPRAGREAGRPQAKAPDFGGAEEGDPAARAGSRAARPLGR